MTEQNFTASQMFRNANRFIEAYHAALQPVCRDTGLPTSANAAASNPALCPSTWTGS